MMTVLFRDQSTHNFILVLVVEIVTDHIKNEWPSPTIRQLANLIGYSEETILESLEYGSVESVTLLQ